MNKKFRNYWKLCHKTQFKGKHQVALAQVSDIILLVNIL